MCEGILNLSQILFNVQHCSFVPLLLHNLCGDIDLQCNYQSYSLYTAVDLSEKSRKWRERDRAKCNAQIAGEKQATLQWKSTRDCKRMANKRATREREVRMRHSVACL